MTEKERNFILNSFLAETAEGLSRMERSILALETHPEDLESIQVVFRVIHNVKGNAGILELKKLNLFAQTLENLLDEIRGENQRVDAELISQLLSSVTVLREMAAAAGEGRDEISQFGKSVLAKISKSISAAQLSGWDPGRSPVQYS
jgi:two-component system, chemotaxis family, sensor kinase CheA